jgi:4-amino-4-deoxy-L-arabinose transferase-like glycosyltransferase
MNIPTRKSLTWIDWIGWIGALVLMLTLLGHPPVQRSQEARVLATAREMLGKPLHDWLIPHLNGHLRLEKPPLAYWLAAWAFQIGGVSEGVGRVPFALFGWGTLILTWTIARRMFNRRAAFYAAASLFSGLMFARHARLAETDILAVFFVTAAVACMLRDDLRWLALSGLMIGLAILAKGLPAVFAIVFLIGLAIERRDAQVLWRSVISGAPHIALAVGVPWFLYVRSAVGLKTIADEAQIGVRGMEHKWSAFLYSPQTLQAVAPWSALTVLAFVLAIAHWRHDRRLRAILFWAAAVIVPLCFAGQKQYHYLFPAMPALAVLTGWLIDRVLAGDFPHSKLGAALFGGTLGVMLLGSASLIVMPRFRGRVLPIDSITFVLCMGGVVATFVMVRRGLPHGLFTFAIAAAVTMTVLTQAWMPSMTSESARTVAAAVRAVGPGPYYFYGENVSLPLVFYLQQVVPRLVTPEELSDAIRKHPDAIVIAQSNSGVTPPPMPEGLERAAELRKEDQTFEVYRVRPRP